MPNQTLIIRSNIHSKEYFDTQGLPFTMGYPEFTLDSTCRIEWHLYEKTPCAGNAVSNPETWSRASYPDCSALLTCDNDQYRRVSGLLLHPISAKTVIRNIQLKIDDPAEKNIQSDGFITLYNTNGKHETFTYTSFRITDSSVTFEIAESETAYAHDAGETVTVSQQTLFQQTPVLKESDPENGIFIFDVVIHSAKLQKKADQNTRGKIAGVWLELLPYKIDAENHYLQYDPFLLKCCSIIIPLGEPGAMACSTSHLDMMLTGFIQQMLGYGFETEVRAENGQNQFRFRSVAAGGMFCDWISIPNDHITVNFDEIKASAFQLPQNSSPEISTSVIRENQKTIVSFDFGIPSGKDGRSYIVISDPAVEFTLADPVYGRIIALDNITPFMTLSQPVWDLKKVRFRCVSAAENISGNVVLIPIVDGVERPETITLAVDGITEYIFPENVTGKLQFKRDTASAADTLKDGTSIVTALIVNMELEVIHP